MEPRERAMLTFAYKLNFQPGKVDRYDADALRAAGFDDRGVLDIVLVVSLFNFMNRLADGLGVEPSPQFVEAKAKGDARAEAELDAAVSARAGK
jgi:uncharacterized peroxidase-related enzyme